jgi:hypothetical protein
MPSSAPLMQRSVRPMPVTARACMHRTALALASAAVAAQRWLKELPDPLLPRDTYFAWTRAGAALKRCKAQVSVRRSSRATCSVQRATCNVQHATCHIQRAACNMQHGTFSMQRATDSMVHTAWNMQQAACMPQAAYNGQAGRLPACLPACPALPACLAAWFPRREACQVHPVDFAQRSSQCSPAPTRRSGRRLPPSSAH